MTEPKDKAPYWAGEPYSQTLERVITALSSKESLVAVTGPAEMGKSAMALELKETLQNNGDATIYFKTPPTSNTDLHQQCRQQHQELDRFAFMVALEKWLLQLNKDKKRCVLIVDEAHLLRAEVITTIRVMNNLQSATHRLLQVVLFGEPDLYKVLGHPQSGGLTQRISLRTELGAMNKIQMKQMMLDLHGLSLDPSAVTLAFKLSQGKIGIAIAISQALHKELGSAGVNRQQLRKAITTDPKLASLLNRHRMKLAMPVVAVALLAVVVWQWPSSLTDEAKPIVAEDKAPAKTADKPASTTKSLAEKALNTGAETNKIEEPKQISEKNAQVEDTVSEQTTTLASSTDKQSDSQFDNKAVEDPAAPSNEATVLADSNSDTTELGLSDNENTDSNSADAINQDETFVANPAPADKTQQSQDLSQTPEVSTPAAQSDNAPDITPTISNPPAQQLANNSQAGIEQELYAVLKIWVEAWQSKNVDEYLDAYTKTFRPTNGESHQQWRQRRIDHIIKTPWMKVSLGEMTIVEHQGNDMVLRIWLDYASPGYKDQTLKELDLIFQNNQWLINKERNKMVKRGELVFTADEPES